VAETCTGTSATCPADGFESSSVECRSATGECDLAENCPGNGPSCPADSKKTAGTACTSDGNPCTLDQCDGTNVTPHHPAGNAGANCLAVYGALRVHVEVCSAATSGSCPADGFETWSVWCRAARGEGDLAESCAGTGPSCPADSKKTSGTACTSDGNPCTL